MIRGQLCNIRERSLQAEETAGTKAQGGMAPAWHSSLSYLGVVGLEQPTSVEGDTTELSRALSARKALESLRGQ